MFITLSSDYIYVLAMLKTTPLVVTVGLALTIPLAVVGDWVFLRIGATPQTIAGAVLVVFSFTALGLEGRQETEEEVGGYQELFDDDEFEDPEQAEGPLNSGEEHSRWSTARRAPLPPSEQLLRPPQTV